MLRKIKKNKDNIFGIISIIVVCFMSWMFFNAPEKSHGLGKVALAKEAETAQTEKAEKVKETQSKEKEKDKLPDVSADDWQLALINAKNPIKKETENLTTLSNGYQVDSRIAADYEAFEKAAKEAGINFVVVSSYRSIAEQETVYNNSINEHLNMGSSQEEAEKLTKEYITVPGNSEHHTGLALDIVDDEWSNDGKGLDDSFYDTKAGKWIDSNAAKYGFVIRYPADKVKITSINYEPWHLRYVGKESAAYMKKNNLVLEEFLEVLSKGSQENTPLEKIEKEEVATSDSDKTETEITE